jgi:uncharacterized protein (TIGR02147 family)
VKERAPSIYEYPDFSSYLRSSLEALRPAGNKYSLRNVARRVGRSPSLLAMVARGDRRPQPELAAEICRVLGLTRTEAQFAEALVEYERARTVIAKTRAADRLRLLKPRHGDLILELETFALVSNWHHGAIVELACTKQFVEDPKWIAKALGATVSPAMAEESLALLQRLGLLTRDESGKLQKSAPTILSPKGMSSTALRAFHKKIMMRANQAIDRQPVGERYFTSVTVAIPAAVIPEINDKIKSFRDELMTFLREQKVADDAVYHLSMQFFRATPEPLG